MYIMAHCTFNTHWNQQKRKYSCMASYLPSQIINVR